MIAATERVLSLPVRVYLEDTDAQGIVYNANYFRFMERARTEWLRAQGINHLQLRSEYGVQLVLTAVEATFRSPAHLGDLLAVEAAVVRARGARVVFEHRIWVSEISGSRRLICDGVAKVAAIDAEEGRPRRLPEVLLAGLGVATATGT